MQEVQLFELRVYLDCQVVPPETMKIAIASLLWIYVIQGYRYISPDENLIR